MDAQQQIRLLLPDATNDQLRAALTAVLDATSEAQSRPGCSDYGINGDRPTSEVEAEYRISRDVGEGIDTAVFHALRGPTGLDGTAGVPNSRPPAARENPCRDRVSTPPAGATEPV